MEKENPILIVMRHGERADKAHDPKCKYEIKFDPCLTTIGLKQTFDTGAFLAKQFNLSARKVYVYCSPLLRTMQSAAQFLRGAKLDATHKINIRNYLVEELFTYEYPVDPLKNCLFRTKERDWLKKNILGGIDYTEDTTPIKYPESNKQVTARCWKGYDYFLKEHGKEKGAAVVLVSHGRMIDEFSDYFLKKSICNMEYCAVSAVEIKGEGKYEALLENSNEHLLV